nr:MAG TPA: hypothetical protein [Caudoviricetes sp.]
MRKVYANVMHIITSRNRSQVCCRTGKGSGRARETPCRNWSTQAQSQDTGEQKVCKITICHNYAHSDSLLWGTL